MCKGFLLILALSFFYCTCSIADENILNSVDDEDFEIDEDFYKSFNQIKIHDPYERLNRSIYRFNKVVDKFIILPPTKIYSIVVPSPVKRRVSCFISNLKEPLNTVYGILQLKPKVAFDSFFRFFMNSTFGILGMFDIAKEAGLKKHDVNFGNVLRYYGAKEGPYLMLPLLGPSTVRGGVGIIVDTIADPVGVINFNNKEKFRTYYYAGRVIVAREQLIGNEKTLSEISLDEYATLRNFYYQTLSKLVEEGN